MKCIILHESAGRLRIHLCGPRLTMERADVLERCLEQVKGVRKVTASERTGNAVILFEQRAPLIAALQAFDYDACGLQPDTGSRQLNREYEEKLYFHVLRHLFTRMFLPASVRFALNVVKAVPYLVNAAKTILKGKVEVPILDAASISMALLQRQSNTAGSIMFLLRLSEILEEWTYRRSVDELARSMALNVDNVWLKTADGAEVLVPIQDVKEGDQIIVRTSNVIPLDGTVTEGEMSVNQSSLTGESLPVYKSQGAAVYAGTVVEEGQCLVRVARTMGSGRYDRIITMIEDSEKLKSEAEDRAAGLSDRLVPVSLLVTGLTWALSGNVTRAMAVLMVDYSCALRLAMPISVLSAMRQCAAAGMTVKGGKYLENIARAKTIVFDKTGTLTHSVPTVASVIPFGGRDENEMLRIAACLEEHYPHSIANAVVLEAKKRGLVHEEMHSRVEYVVAHGIASSIEGEKVVVGSYHFVFEDEHCTIREEDRERFDSLPRMFSLLYMAIGGELAAVMCIDDPIRAEAAEIVAGLKERGLYTVMMTGDSFRTAQAVAGLVQVDEFHAEVLPEEKAAYVTKAKQDGRKVIMVGDGINDSPALSASDCGIAVSDGAAIAREIADVTIAMDSLYALRDIKDIADALESRLKNNYRFILSFNSGLILLGAFGLMPAATAAYLHNISTLLISVHAMSNLPCRYS